VNVRFSLFAGAALALLPFAAAAQSAPADSAPGLLARGTNTTALAGKGDVVVQVFVKKNGSFEVSKIIKSTNPGDNAAALEIAKSSKYKPAIRNGHAADEYYDFALSFGGDTSAIGSGPLPTALNAIHEGKYDLAESTLTAYLQTHPDDTQAYTLLGVAEGFAGDYAGSSAAFAKAGTIPDEYKVLAVTSYTKNATALLDAKDLPNAIDAATHALALDPNDIQALYVRGIAQANQHSDPAAIADLKSALATATSLKSDDATMGIVAYNLALVQFDAGAFDDAAQTAKALAGYDPARRTQLDRTAVAAYNNSAVSMANAGDIAGAVTRLEAGAANFPAVAGALTAEAAYIMAIDKKPDWTKVRAEADKALGIEPTNGRAAFVAGIAASHLNDAKAALDYMNKAKASPAYGTDASLAKQIDDALKSLNPPAK
jgi:cytochrome c-type biogenesis protein CcmH/NrfG